MTASTIEELAQTIVSHARRLQHLHHRQHVSRRRSERLDIRRECEAIRHEVSRLAERLAVAEKFGEES